MKIEKYYELIEECYDSRLLISLENIEDLSIALSDVVIVKDKKDNPKTSRENLNNYIYSIVGEETKNLDIYPYNVIKTKDKVITKYSVSYEKSGLGIKTSMFIDAMIKKFKLVLNSVTLEEKFVEVIEKVANLGAFLLLDTNNFEVREAKVKEGYKFIDDEGRFIITFDEEGKDMVRKRIK